MISQAAFNFPAPPAPQQSDVERLVNHLHDAGETWLTASQLAAVLGLTDRKIRKLAEHSDGLIVSGPGCPGYRHIDHCTPSILSEVADRLKSQARSMIRRSIRIRNRAHSRIR